MQGASSPGEGVAAGGGVVRWVGGRKDFEMAVLDTSCPADQARVAGLMDGLLRLARGSTIDGRQDDGRMANEFRRLSGGDYRLVVVCTRTAGVDEVGAWGGGVVGAAVAAPGRATEDRAGCGRVSTCGMRALLVQDEVRGAGVARDMLSVLQEVLRGRQVDGWTEWMDGVEPRGWWVAIECVQ